MAVGLRDRLKKPERATEGEKYELVCPECGEGFVAYCDAPLKYMAWECVQNSGGESYRETPADVIHMTEHEHDAATFINKATGEPFMDELFGDLIVGGEDGA